MAAEQSQARHGGSGRLGGARADFVAGLGRKVSDLRAALARVKEDATDLPKRDELRRRLHALASSAKLMKFDAMERAIAEALGALDRTPIDAALEALDIEMLEQVLEDLPALAWGDEHARSSRVEKAAKAPASYTALVVGSSLIAEPLLEVIDEGRPSFACECTPDAQAAFDLVKATAPDLVVLDADIADSALLVEALADDPLTEATPIVVVGSFLEAGEAARFVAMGVTKTLPKPTSREALRKVCEEAVDPGRGLGAAHAALGDATLEQLGERLAAELREAIVGRADPAVRGKMISLGEGSEVLGALWGAIARVREVVTARTDGQVRFAPGPDRATIMTNPFADADVPRSDRARARMRGPAAEVRLQGRRVVVADDDPAVVWFMADLLKTAGFTVFEAFDGKQALELAYETSPDLVVSDLLMPKLDGFSLCRALRRDVALRDVPVILLSWKEDLLQRVRELGAGAAGYVRKESDTRAIVARVREALRARARIEARVREDGEVRGRLDGVSVRTLLEIVCATRPEARVSVRDASFLYEVEIRFGAPVRATRTSGDGAFLKGTRVLSAMLGASAGRFTVTTSAAPIDADLDGNLAAQLAKPIAKARAAIGLLTGEQMGRVARVLLDDAMLQDYLRATPEPARGLARRMASGTAPRALTVGGACEPSLVEDLACDLAARGLVVGIEGDDGTDLLGPRITALMLHTDTRASFAPRTTTPSPVPALADALDAPESSGPKDACSSDADAPVCESPAPGNAASLEDAVIDELAHRSPSPVDATPVSGAPALAGEAGAPGDDPFELTPSRGQLLALAEPTVVDDTVYGEESIPIELMSKPLAPTDPERLTKTPLTSVRTHETPLEIPRRRALPMVAFMAATAVVAWAVAHFSGATGAHAQKQAPREPAALPAAAPTPATTVEYTDVAAGAAIPTGQGVLDVSAPGDAIVLVDGAERGRGRATLPLWSGSHDVRIHAAAGVETRAVEVRAAKVAHVKF